MTQYKTQVNAPVCRIRILNYLQDPDPDLQLEFRIKIQKESGTKYLQKKSEFLPSNYVNLCWKLLNRQQVNIVLLGTLPSEHSTAVLMLKTSEGLKKLSICLLSKVLFWPGSGTGSGFGLGITWKVGSGSRNKLFGSYTLISAKKTGFRIRIHFMRIHVQI